MYGVESDKRLMESMPASLSDQIKEIEQALLDLLIKSSFDHCILDTGSRNLNIFAAEGRKINHLKPIAGITGTSPRSNLSEIIGIKSSPIDLANGSKYSHSECSHV
jgi:hypothetical protein